MLNRRAARWLGLFALLAAVALGGLAVRHALQPAPAATPPAAGIAGQAQDPLLRLQRLAAMPGLTAASPATAASAASWRDRDDVEIPPEGGEVCGVRRVSAEELRRWKTDRALAEAEVRAIDAQMDRRGRDGVARLSARLAAGNTRQQVAARLLMQDRDGAALLVQHSRDAQAYQLALLGCRAGPASAPSCARLDARRWAALDPADARPWLWLLAEAYRRNDAAGVDAALAEAAARPRLSRASHLLEAEAVAVADVVAEPGELGPALVYVMGVDAAMVALEFGAAFRVCSGEALRDATRLLHCRAVARQVLASATDFMEAQLAQKLADRTGVPGAQQAHDADTLKRAVLLYQQVGGDLVGRSCASMRRTQQWSATRAAAGELGMALSALRASQPAN